ncbi:hypothetical protein [Saccharothrix sp. NRRL B-16348]|uniref:hypothetical protein n=1 Tax=Saccharothrix sp. NRRL B-16348 TaxID=1415542 RepID=UPI0006AE358A|nr:hypothetical protein [Saccharothrix sp. NRRL B-16348]
MLRIGLAAAVLLLAALWAVAQVPAVLVGLPHPAPGQTPPGVAAALERCVALNDPAPAGSFNAGPSMVRGRETVVVARSESVFMVCSATATGADTETRTGAARREIDHGKVVSATGLTDYPSSGSWYTYGAVRADVAKVNIRTASGRVVAAQVGGGSFLADLTGVPKDPSPNQPVYQALDAGGAVLHEGS